MSNQLFPQFLSLAFFFWKLKLKFVLGLKEGSGGTNYNYELQRTAATMEIWCQCASQQYFTSRQSLKSQMRELLGQGAAKEQRAGLLSNQVKVTTKKEEAR